MTKRRAADKLLAEASLETLPTSFQEHLRWLRDEEATTSSNKKARTEVIAPSQLHGGLEHTARELGVDYIESENDYALELNESDLARSKSTLRPDFASVISFLKYSKYVRGKVEESLRRTLLDLILLDRLSALEDDESINHLMLSTEVPVQTTTKRRQKIVRGQADWVLAHGRDKRDTGSVLMVVEAKPEFCAEASLSQLLAYMVCVFDARKQKLNQVVFGVCSDASIFRFAMLDANKKLWVSDVLHWKYRQNHVLAYFDKMLRNAIESSPPTKSGNAVLRNYSQYLGSEWDFGAGNVERDRQRERERQYEILDQGDLGALSNEGEDESDENEDGQDESIVNVTGEEEDVIVTPARQSALS